jgi:hypothetical protein
MDTTIGLNFGDPGTKQSAWLTISRQAGAATLAHEIGHCGQLDDGTDIPNGQVRGIDSDGNPACLIPVGKENFMPMTRKPYNW